MKEVSTARSPREKRCRLGNQWEAERDGDAVGMEVVLDLDASAMPISDTSTDGEAQTGAAGLGRYEGIEHLFQDRWSDADACVRNVDHGLRKIGHGSSANAERHGKLTVRIHRFNGVEE